jgi:hypothetical protein
MEGVEAAARPALRGWVGAIGSTARSSGGEGSDWNGLRSEVGRLCSETDRAHG